MRVGFIGAGLIATYHSKMVRRSGVVIEPAGVYDPDPERLAAFAAASGHPARRSEEEVIEASDAVYVCTWTSEHPRLVAAAAARGRHVFCEKPLAVDLATAEAMTHAVVSAGITHQVGLVLRFSPAYVLARHLVADQAAGPVMAVVCRDDQYIPIQGHYASTWRADRHRAGAGTLLEHSIHDVDMLAHLAGAPIETVSAHQANFHGLDGIEDVVSAVVRFAGGATGTLTTVWHDNLARPSLRRVEVLCARRHVVIDGSDWYGPVSWTDADGTTGSLTGDELVAAAEPLVDHRFHPDRAFLLAADARTPAFPDFTVARRAHRVVDAMYRSAASGGTPVTVEPSAEVVEIPTRETLEVRARVLRRGTPSADPRYAQDDAPGTVHLGALVDGRLVATSTWAVEAWRDRPEIPAVRLRGMAVDDDRRGAGVGAALVAAGVSRARAAGARLVWASARDSALGFYRRLGFRVVGEGYVDAPTGLPHHDIVLDLVDVRSSHPAALAGPAHQHVHPDGASDHGHEVKPLVPTPPD